MVQVFSLAVECALDRERPVPPEEALDLWALAASLQVTQAGLATLHLVISHQSLGSGLCMREAYRKISGPGVNAVNSLCGTLGGGLLSDRLTG